jgi:hypothetical protein
MKGHSKSEPKRLNCLRTRQSRAMSDKLKIQKSSREQNEEHIPSPTKLRDLHMLALQILASGNEAVAK